MGSVVYRGAEDLDGLATRGSPAHSVACGRATADFARRYKLKARNFSSSRTGDWPTGVGAIPSLRSELFTKCAAARRRVASVLNVTVNEADTSSPYQIGRAHV